MKIMKFMTNISPFTAVNIHTGESSMFWC